MALDGSGIEPRDGNGSFKIVLHFDRPIQSGTANVSSGTGSAGTVSFSGNDMLVDLSGVSNAQRLTLTANNVGAVSGGVLSSVNVTIGFLIGDTTGNGAVNSSDISQTQAQSGQAISASNFREDVTVNGAINSSDISAVQAKSGTALP
jgi:hypothetical protein